MPEKTIATFTNKEFMIRSATWEDVISIVDLWNASSQDTRAANSTAVHWQKRHWYETGIDLDSDSLVVIDGNLIVGYIELVSEPPFIIHEMAGVVQPRYRRMGIGRYLIHWAENRAQKLMENAPANAAIFIHNSIFDSNLPGRALLSRLGYTVVRDFVNLQVVMHHKPPDPVWPDGITVKPLVKDDWVKVGPALREAFEDHWGQIEYVTVEMQEKSEDEKPDPQKTDPAVFDEAYFNSPGLRFVAWDGDQVVGSCFSNAKTVEFPDAGYIGSLSVRRPWRERGVGRALTLHALNAFYDRGTRHVLTDTDGDSLTRAYSIYQNAGMEIFRQELVYEKMIRLGRDFVKRNLSEMR